MVIFFFLMNTLRFIKLLYFKTFLGEYFFNYTCVFACLVALCSKWDLSSPTRDRTYAPALGVLAIRPPGKSPESFIIKFFLSNLKLLITTSPTKRHLWWEKCSQKCVSAQNED